MARKARFRRKADRLYASLAVLCALFVLGYVYTFYRFTSLLNQIGEVVEEHHEFMRDMRRYSTRIDIDAR